jgi:predicted MFS family arabinose efflux permease
MSLISFVTATNGQFFAPILPQVARDLGVTPAAVGQLVTVSALAGAALAVAAGPLSDQYGRRPLMLLGMGALVVTALGAAAAPSYPILLGVRFLTGAGMALMTTSVMAAVADRVPEARQPQAIGWVVGFSAGAIVIGWPAIALISAAWSWRVGFVLIAALTLLLIPLVLWLVPRSRGRGARPDLGGYLRAYRGLLGDAALIRALLANGLAAAAWFGFSTYLGAFLQSVLAIGVAEQAPIFTAIGVAYFLASVGGGALAARLGVRPVAILSNLTTALLLVAFSRVDGGLPIAVALAIGVAALRAGGLTSLNSLVLALRPSERGTVSALSGLTFSVGITAGAGLGGAALALGGFGLLGLALAGLATASAALLFAGERRRARADPAGRRPG